MNIAVISDTHDDWVYIKKAIEIIKERSCDVLLHCGDVVAPITMKYIADSWNKELHLVFGNVDGDRWLIGERVKDNDNVHIHGEALAQLAFDGKRIAMQHYPELAERLAQSGQYHAVFYGHNHIMKVEEVTQADGITLLANPGTLNPSMMNKQASFGIYDTQANKMELVSL